MRLSVFDNANESLQVNLFNSGETARIERWASGKSETGKCRDAAKHWYNLGRMFKHPGKQHDKWQDAKLCRGQDVTSDTLRYAQVRILFTYNFHYKNIINYAFFVFLCVAVFNCFQSSLLVKKEARLQELYLWRRPY